MSNYAEMMDALRIYREAMRTFVLDRLKDAYGDLWWQQGVEGHFKVEELGRLRDILERQSRDVGVVGSTAESIGDMLDINHFRQIIEGNWKAVFRERLKNKSVMDGWMAEVTGARNLLAHWTGGEVEKQAALRFIHSCQLVVQQVDAARAAEIRLIYDRVDRGTTAPPPVEAPSPGADGTGQPVPGLPPWRMVVFPHRDVQEGKYQQAEFAADLAQVVRGTAEPEYQDPREFFRRTFVTADMGFLLRQAAQRLAGRGGDPVVDLKTSFGGGKTHTLLALYHLVKYGEALSGLPSVRALLDEAGVPAPRAAVAVIVGTDISPTLPFHEDAAFGTVALTMWGSIAYQLGGWDAFRLVAADDARGVAPGAATLAALFEKVGPSVILVDELVAFLRKIEAHAGLPCGDYNNHLSFFQSLTEAVKRVPHSLLLVSIPESRIEYGDGRGEAIANRIEHTIGRLSRPWQPVTAREAFEVVRRRLFEEITDTNARDAVCEEFGKLYRQNATDFPAECRENAYIERMKASYPIHPELFERLYGEWSRLERFQRTRGVLRLMATAISRLWIDNDQSPLIMPGSLPLYSPRVRDELIRYVGDAWNAVIDNDVDGEASEPYRVENESPRFGQLQAARRITRTIFLGATPAENLSGAANRGIEDVRIKLGVVQPGESISTYGDALGRLQQRLTFLYSSNGRYWLAVQPNLNKTVSDRISRVTRDEVIEELEGRLRRAKERGDFAGVHACPAEPSDVPDVAEARLVILSPRWAHARSKGTEPSAAEAEAAAILGSRGNAPRTYRNMVVFAAIDASRMEQLSTEVAQYLAWQSIEGDARDLNLDDLQRRQATELRERSDRSVSAQLEDAYQWTLVPTQAVTDQGIGPVTWEALVTKTGALDGVGGIAVRASNKLRSAEYLVSQWSPIHLKAELDRYFWRDGVDHIGVSTLWDSFATYLYFQRLRDRDVLRDTIRVGAAAQDFFGYAAGVRTEGAGYDGLFFGQLPPQVLADSRSVVVRKDVARDQLAPPPPPLARTDQRDDTANGAGDRGVPPPPQVPETSPPAARPKTRFYGRLQVDPSRLSSAAGSVAREVLTHLSAPLGAEVEVVIEVRAKLPGGASDEVERAVSENARTLKFEFAEFEE